MAKRVHIFAVDEDDDDTYLLKEAFCELNECPILEIYRSGPALLEKLSTLSPEDYPDLILLDMNLHGLLSQDVLRQLKASAPLNLIPVLTLTASLDSSSLVVMHQLGTNAILPKSAHFSELVRTVQAIDEFWLRRAWLPTSVLKISGKSGWGTS